MANHTSATEREHTPHVNQTRTATILNALTRRAQAVLNDTSIDAQTRAIIRYGLETNDPWLARLVKRAETGESIVDAFDFSKPSEIDEFDSTPSTCDSSQEKIEALAELICRAGAESAAALFVLMGTLQNSAQPKAFANTAKHFAFTRCGELNLYGIVDTHIAIVEARLFSS